MIAGSELTEQEGDQKEGVQHDLSRTSLAAAKVVEWHLEAKY